LDLGRAPWLTAFARDQRRSSDRLAGPDRVALPLPAEVQEE